MKKLIPGLALVLLMLGGFVVAQEQTPPGPVSATSCGSSLTCAAPTSVSTPMKFIEGTAAMSASTTVTVSGITPLQGAFTSAATYHCDANDLTNAYTSGVKIVSGSSITIVSGTSNSDTWNWGCWGH